MHTYIEKVVDLIDPETNMIHNLSVDEARQRILDGPVDSVGQISGSFALIAQAGKTVRMARSLDRPMRYFLAKQQAGPVLIVASRIDTIVNGWRRKDSRSNSIPVTHE